VSDIAIVSGGDGWHLDDLARAAALLGHATTRYDFRTLSSDTPLHDHPVIIVRTMPAGSLEQIVFRMDLLQLAERRGVLVFNPPRALESAIDKYLTTERLQLAGIPVPPTWCGQTADAAQVAFETLGGDVVVKPIFGSLGCGLMRISDPELAWRTFRTLERTQATIYQQQFIHHPGYDVRAFVLGNRVIASMKRYAKMGWRTNLAQGGMAEAWTLPQNLIELAVRASACLGTVMAGVDLLSGPDDQWYVLEVNAVPGWRGLSEVSGIDIAQEILSAAIGDG